MEGYMEIERFNDRRIKISVVENITTKNKNLLKLYPNHTILQYEADWLTKLRGNTNVRVPKIIKSTDRELLLEYINGRTLLQELIDGAMFKINILAGSLARYYKAFHELEGQVIEDIDLNCYILRGGLLNGFDFVSVKKGELEDIASEVIATVLVDLRISDIRKQMFIREFLRVFGGSVLQYREKTRELMAEKMTKYSVKGFTLDELYKIVGKV